MKDWCFFVHDRTRALGLVMSCDDGQTFETFCLCQPGLPFLGVGTTKAEAVTHVVQHTGLRRPTRVRRPNPPCTF